MNLYCIEYVDDSDPGCPTFEVKCKADNMARALDRFYESDDFETGGWKILRVARVTDAPRHTWSWVKVNE